MTRWLLVGVGDIATKRVIPALQQEPRSEIAAVVSRTPAKGRAYAPEVFPDLDSALASAAFDAVYLATPVSLHAPQTIAALRAGKHVLCEKPTALDYAEALTMVDAARETGKLLGVSYYRRLYPKVLRARQLVAEGAIGRPVLAELENHSWFQAEDGKRAWLLDPVMSGGGPLYDIASHRIDLLNFFFGEPARACGQRSRVVHQSRVEDSATALVEYGNGVRGIVDVRWHSRVERDRFRIVGTEGEIDLSPLNGPDLVYPGGEESIPAPRNLHYPLIRNFVDAIEGKAALASPVRDAVRTDWVTAQVLAASPEPSPSYSLRT
ncbi:MAG: Gfo/Idh/MocA family oxidoreductase [Bryobacteraceae bacterium]